MFLQNNTTTTLKMSHKHSYSVLAQRFASVFIRSCCILLIMNKARIKYSKQMLEKVFVDLFDQVQENSSNCMNKLEFRKWSSFGISAED